MMNNNNSQGKDDSDTAEELSPMAHHLNACEAAVQCLENIYYEVIEMEVDGPVSDTNRVNVNSIGHGSGMLS